MAINSITNSVAAQQASTYTATKTDYTEKKSESSTKADTGVVYEKSSDQTSGTVTKKTDYALINKLKADAEERTSQLRSLVEKMMTKQGVAIGTADSMWSFLAKGDFTVDEATRAQAQADIADDGYWGVDQTSDRILDFAKALSGNDPEKADLLLDAFKKGFKEATKSWGQDLPDISQRTYDAVVEKFNKWKNGTEETEAAQTQA
ncbi:hypothetical protein [Roseburia hominis]|uniref:hypothetical protein n=1 Tax=Roseburia hominis TaxID=301301 RepID=UPI0026EAACCE|nr:hypothetical protein [Roseburia hominis]MCI7523704.1 hypothetical protein [Roseburia hominis]